MNQLKKYLIVLLLTLPLWEQASAGSCVATFGGSTFGNSQFGTNGIGCRTVVVAPGQPTITSTLAGNQQITLAFTSGTGGPADSYTATCTSNNGGATGIVTAASSPIIVTGLTNGKNYTCQLTATNTTGTSTASTASGPVIPAIPPTPSPEPIPTLSEWAKISMMFLMIVTVGWYGRRLKQR